jgi:hypothetical protein
MIRVGVGVEPGERQPFSVRCPECASHIRGRLITTEDASVFAELDEAPILSGSEHEDWHVITVHPAFPFIPDAQVSPFLHIVHVLGDATVPYFGSVAQFNAMIAESWPALERAFQFYFDENWDRFDVRCRDCSKMSGLISRACWRGMT